jgi:hypothetical protein
MDGAHFIAALASALLHARWNAAIKACANPRQAMAAQIIAAAARALGLCGQSHRRSPYSRKSRSKMGRTPWLLVESRPWHARR